ncbi:MAG: hypothetical protein K0S26_1267, partial [Bacteroidota bacterium]|nr:hypothetical protein [Bacteroidota bacterium]
VDMQGRVIKSFPALSLESKLDISDLVKGQYILNLLDKNKTIISKPFMVE